MKAQLADFTPDNNLYLVEYPYSNEDNIVEIKIVEIMPYNKTFHFIKIGEGVSSCLHQRFFSDCGIVGLGYDDRPCKVYTSKEAAKNALKECHDWHHSYDWNNDFNDYDDDYDDYDEYFV